MKDGMPKGEEMTREEAIRRGLVVMTKQELAAFERMTEQQRQVFLSAKSREYRKQQKERFAADLGAALEHPLARFSEEDRRRKALRRRR